MANSMSDMVSVELSGQRFRIVFSLLIIGIVVCLELIGNQNTLKVFQETIAMSSHDHLSAPPQTLETSTEENVRQPTDTAANRGPRNLVAFTAVGEKASVKTVHYNVFSHFIYNESIVNETQFAGGDEDWACIVFVHVNETHLPNNVSLEFVELQEACSVLRLPGLFWTHFLKTLSPSVLSKFDHIAIILEDVFAPRVGPDSVHVPTLLQTMHDLNVSTITPSIRGSAWPSTQPIHRKSCLVQVELLETFFQVFTTKYWTGCYWNWLHHSNPQATCLDSCIYKLCGKAYTQAVDERMVAYHIGRQLWVDKYVPAPNLAGANLVNNMRLHRQNMPGVPFRRDLCEQYDCDPEKEEMSRRDEIWCKETAPHRE